MKRLLAIMLMMGMNSLFAQQSDEQIMLDNKYVQLKEQKIELNRVIAMSLQNGETEKLINLYAKSAELDQEMKENRDQSSIINGPLAGKDMVKFLMICGASTTITLAIIAAPIAALAYIFND